MEEKNNMPDSILNRGEIYKTIFELSPEAIVLLDPKGNVMTVNERIHDWLGFDTKDIIGKNILTLPFIPPRSKPKIIAKFTQRVLGKTVPPYEAEFVHADGRTLIGMIYATPIRTEEGKVIGDLILADDITERKQVQNSLEDSEERYRNVVERANDGICVLKDHELIFVNTRFAMLVGCEPDEIIFTNVDQYIHPEDLDDFKSFYDKHLSGKEESSRFDTSLINTKGLRIDIEVSASFFFYRSEQRTLVFIRDITDRKKIETELREFKTISDRANYGVAILDLKGELTYVNNTFARLHGYKIEELKGRNRSILYQPEQLEKALMLDQKILARGGVSGQELWQTRKDGTIFPALISGAVIKNEEDDPLYVAATMIDITESKLAEHRVIESEEKYRTLVQNLNIGVYRIEGGDNGKFIHLNTAMAKIFGYNSVDIFMELPVTSLYQDQKGRIAFLNKIVQKGFVKDYELELRKNDGTPIIAACSAQVEYDEDGNIQWIDGVLEDVTERKLAERKLAEQKIQLDKVNQDLKWKIEQLEAAFNHIKRLEGLMPICASCKKMLVEGEDPKVKKSWVPFETFISERTDASFTHGLCPECVKKMYGDIKK